MYDLSHRGNALTCLITIHVFNPLKKVRDKNDKIILYYSKSILLHFTAQNYIHYQAGIWGLVF